MTTVTGGISRVTSSNTLSRLFVTWRVRQTVITALVDTLVTKSHTLEIQVDVKIKMH